jgi:hypothetical protein
MTLLDLALMAILAADPSLHFGARMRQISLRMTAVS